MIIDFLWELFEHLSTIFEAFIMTRFVFSFNYFDWKASKNRVIYACCSFGYAILVTVFNYFTVYEGLLGIVYIAYYIIISLIFINGKIAGKIFSSILCILIVLVANAIVSSAVSTVFRENVGHVYSKQELSRFILIVLVQTLLVVAYDAILKITGKEHILLNKREWGLIISVFTISFVATALIHTSVLIYKYDFLPSVLLMCAEICVIAVIAVCFYMTLSLSKSRKAAEELRIEKQQKEYRLQYAENIKQQYEEIHMIRHDMKHAYSIINMLLQDGKYDEAEKYVQSNNENITSTEMIIDVGNDFVNAILNSKLSLAKTKGIEVLCGTANNLDGVQDEDLCTLLGNMLDNAIEACILCEKNKRLIEVNISSYSTQIVITVSNTVEGDVLKENRDLVTTKKDANNHGFGVESIRQIAKKYDGYVRFYQENSGFYCKVLLLKQS